MNSKQTFWITGIGTIWAAFFLFMPTAAAQQQAQPAPPVQAQQASPAAAPAPNQNQAQAAAPASDEKKDDDETVFDNGVKMKILRAGKGPKPAPNAIVQIQYIGSLEDGTEFDRSYSRRYPSIYKLSDVIGCWQTGIPEMQVGSKAKFTCPPGSANGKRPVDFIWGDTTLYFVIELIAITG
ncbi:MAG: FKBP-type peptidyl-prolyl cis-trans isomerase [Alistipes senegalensis]|nr:FKBP-type peptidyl-prolyl cis-trans isomerase [Oxalobacter formigenes]MCM1281537.1 FKBP-type peptidyl-prolyl cis-trans isomerase [Alistipes senegalensis]